MREENLGPVANPDGSPTELSLEMMGISRERYEENLRNFKIPYADPEFEELDSDDWKILFMIFCENRGKIDLEAGLTDHGKRLLKAVTRKIGINAVGVDIDAV